jgi:hypothetical protein
MTRFELQPLERAAVPDVAAFIDRWRHSGTEGPAALSPLNEPAASIERRLRWLLIDNPTAAPDHELGYCVRDAEGVIRGINLFFPVAYRFGEKPLLGLCSGSFFVEPPARSTGFFVFKKYLGTPGYSFYFASTCNASSGELWKIMGGHPVPNSDMEYILPLRLDVVIPTLVAARTSSDAAARIARICSRGANPVLAYLTRRPTRLAIEPCQDWEKLAELARRHRPPACITSDRSAALLNWRYGPASPAYPCRLYLLRDEAGNEGWFCLGNIAPVETGQFRESILLEAIWPREKMDPKRLFREILRVAADSADAIYFRWQPGLAYNQYSRWVIPHRLKAPRAYASIAKGAPRFPLDSLDYDDSDYVAWKF